jgi:hypothetical protein
MTSLLQLQLWPAVWERQEAFWKTVGRSRPRPRFGGWDGMSDRRVGSGQVRSGQVRIITRYGTYR